MPSDVITEGRPASASQADRGGSADENRADLGAPQPERKDEKYAEGPEDEAAVKQWLKRIDSAEKKWFPDFKMMKESMEFVRGLQWEGQQDVHTESYINNVTLKMVNQKVANLYARNPEVAITRRERMDFAVWDGSQEMLQGAMQVAAQAEMQAAQAAQMGQPTHTAPAMAVPPEMMAILRDYQEGRAHQKLVDSICKTLTLLVEYQWASVRPEFKEQMKMLVRRVITCGVGYVKPIWVDDSSDAIGEYNASDRPVSMRDLAERAALIANKLKDGKISKEDPLLRDLKNIMLSLGHSLERGDDQMHQRLEFDFPPSTSIIPDESCKSLKEFVGARWIAQRYRLPLDEANAFFGSNVEYTSEMKHDAENEPKELKGEFDQKDDPKKKPMGIFYEVFDYDAKVRFVVCKGYKCYVLPPDPPTPAISGFWPIFALTFNDIEANEESECRTSIFPPSDVFLVIHPQRERNRSRDAFRDQRVANLPGYIVRQGFLSDEDKRKLMERKPNSVIELANIPPDTKPADFIMPIQWAKVDPALYDTGMVQEDMELAVGVQTANIGPAQPNVTATVGTIAEQSRMTVATSNIDDLDGLLSRVAKACVEMLLKAMPKETVIEILGHPVWPQENPETYLKLIDIDIKASSSGRPNKAVESANFERLAPILMQLGANPIAVIEEGVKRLDERLDIQKFFPIPGLSPAMAPGGQPAPPPQGGGPAGPQQPLQQMSAEAPPVPLAGA